MPFWAKSELLRSFFYEPVYHSTKKELANISSILEILARLVLPSDLKLKIQLPYFLQVTILHEH
ncbi:hypothetical protein AS888_05800 [Peribacillus simplex]|uniref:Uncharacterized protein n=1 Tax=Peribacillus simplex TaxID=1478 RepID=A0A120GQX4_9BACI|nr:hypothetical protein AS888_05800 [Peribacillus simplex]